MNLREFQESPWMYLYVLVGSAVAIAVVQVVFGDGIDWVWLIPTSALVTFGLWIGRFVRARRTAQ